VLITIKLVDFRSGWTLS